MKLQNISIRKRLIGAFSILIAIMVIIGSLAVYYLFTINNNLKTIFTRNLPAIDYIIEADRDMQQLLVAERTMIFTKVKSDEFTGFLEEYEENLKQTKERVDKYRKLATTSEEKELLKKYDKAYKEWIVLSRQVVDGRKADTRDGRRLALDLTLGQAKQKFESMRDCLDKLTELNLKQAEESEEKANKSFNFAIYVFIGLLILGIILAGFMTLVISRSITRPLSAVVTAGESIAKGVLPEKEIDETGKDELARLSSVFNHIIQSLSEKCMQLSEIADGDLTIDIHSLSEEDQFAKTFEKMLESLNSTLGQIQNSSKQVTNGSHQLSQISQNLASGASEQAATLEEIESSIVEVTNQADKNAQNAQEAQKRAGESSRTAQKGHAQILKIVEAMKKINTSADSISAIIKTINDIAFQTNLLALNAAVEAARAGQYGKGFAVVAEEVRSLAQSSAHSAASTTAQVEEAIQNITIGNELVEETAEEFKSILESSSQLVTIVESISTESEKQALGLEQINKALVQVDQVVQNNAASAEENASMSEEFSAQSETLQSMVKRFKLAVGSSGIPSQHSLEKLHKEEKEHHDATKHKIESVHASKSIPTSTRKPSSYHDVEEIHDPEDYGKY